MSDELPQQWAMVSLADLVDFNPKHSPTTPDSTEVTFVPMAAVSETRPQLDVSQTKAFGAVRKGFTHFADGDVLFAKITPCMENGKGGVAMGLRNGIGCGTTELVVMRPRDALDPLFLYRFLAQPSVRAAARENFTGTAGQARVPASFLQELAIPVPPLDEQRRIVAKLEKLLGRVDACRQRLAKIPALLKRFRQSVLAAACSGRLTADWRKENPNVEPATTIIDRLKATAAVGKVRRGVPESVPVSDVVADWELPETWGSHSTAELLRCGAFVDVKDGNHGANHPKVSEFTETGLPFITAAQVNNYRIDYDGAYKLSGGPLARIRVGFAKSGDVIYTHKGSVGRVAVADRDCVLTPQTTYYRVNRRVFSNGFVMFYLASQAFSDQVNVVKEQTTRDFVPISEQYLLFHRIPPLPEQQEIVRQVESLFALADRIEARLSVAQRQVDALTPSLLARAFAGKLVPQDPNDEPAPALLERIRAHAHREKQER